MTSAPRFVALVGLILACFSCAPQKRIVDPSAHTLRVGVSADLPPLAFMRGDGLAGVEVDLARELARELKLKVRFIRVPWNDLMPALVDNRIDVIMSGMTVTRAREFQIAFADPYLRTGILGMSRRGEIDRYRKSRDAVLKTSERVGGTRGTTAEKFIQEKLTDATVRLVDRPADAIAELQGRRLDLFLADAPTIAWLVSENESVVAMTTDYLTNDAIAWGFRPGNDRLRSKANAILDRWRSDGTLKIILKRWLPNLPSPQ